MNADDIQTQDIINTHNTHQEKMRQTANTNK